MHPPRLICSDIITDGRIIDNAGAFKLPDAFPDGSDWVGQWATFTAKTDGKYDYPFFTSQPSDFKLLGTETPPTIKRILDAGFIKSEMDCFCASDIFLTPPDPRLFIPYIAPAQTTEYIPAGFLKGINT